MAFPGIQEARGLDDKQLEALSSLERRVLAHDGGRMKLEWGVLRQRPPDDVNDLLAWDGDTLAGFCGIYEFGKEPELAGAVDPARRGRGIGSALLDRALELVARRGRSSALLVTPRATDSGRRFAGARGATFDHAEHHMELEGPPTGPPAPRPSTDGLVIRPTTDADRATVVHILEDAFGNAAAALVPTDPKELALVVERDSAVIGTVRLGFEGRAAGVYGLAIRSELRGRGIGRAVLYEVCLEARRRGAGTVTLEVDVDNDRALGLYTSVGFELRATEDYFRLAA